MLASSLFFPHLLVFFGFTAYPIPHTSKSQRFLHLEERFLCLLTYALGTSGDDLRGLA
jgi:hypothetical protein